MEATKPNVNIKSQKTKSNPENNDTPKKRGRPKKPPMKITLIE